ncbi:MAG: PmoA family protein [Chitinophagaceae bacterium]|nr:PmoA family protein [Chitinophagaceae bacterium]
MIRFQLFLSILLSTQTLLAQRITLNAANQLPGTPVFIQLPNSYSLLDHYEIVDTKTGKKFAAQLLDSSTIVFLMPAIKTLNPAIFNLQKSKLVRRSLINVTQSDSGLRVSNNNKPVFFYHTAIVDPPADSPSYYQRSGFIHPLYTPSGVILTDDFPVGHVHQHALFAAWTNTTYRNQFIDFWNQHSKKGTVTHSKIIEVTEGPVCARIKLLLHYVSNEFGKILDEKWTITIYPTKSYFLFDLELDQHNNTTDTLYINKYHYGGMALRGSKHWNPDDKINYQSPWSLLTSEGYRDSAANHTKAKWVDVSGTINKSKAGLTVFNHPTNFRHPQPIRVHPAMPYWVYAPMVDSLFSIAPGASYHAQFRYYVHEGSADEQFIHELWKNYSAPPKAIIKDK